MLFLLYVVVVIQISAPAAQGSFSGNTKGSLKQCHKHHASSKCSPGCLQPAQKSPPGPDVWVRSDPDGLAVFEAAAFPSHFLVIRKILERISHS
jgi:hypothetical protein